MDSPGGPFTASGLLYWNGSNWIPMMTPAGDLRWDGTAWAAVPPTDWSHDIQLDDRSTFDGLTPAAGKFPTKPIFRNSGIAVGGGWVATPGPVRWHLAQFAEVLSVGVVGPSVGQQVFGQRMPGGNDAELRLVLDGGRCLGINASRMPPEVRQLVLDGLSSSTTVSPAAGAFLIGFFRMPGFGIPGMQIRR